MPGPCYPGVHQSGNGPVVVRGPRVRG
jgi:hypothetical protein